jgi:hypothetical protein
MDLDTVYFDGTDDGAQDAATGSTNKDKDIHTSEATDHIGASSSYSSNSKWYIERMKFAYEKLMEHEFKWLEEEKEEYEKTKVLPENSLHSNIAEFREQDAKEMLAINEALNKFNLRADEAAENLNDIGSKDPIVTTDNKRSMDDAQATHTEDQSSVKKSRTE